jgi:hypothetical protein
MLPHRDPPRPGDSKYAKTNEKESYGKGNEEPVCDGGFNFLHIKGTIIGTLSENVKDSSADVFEDVRRGFEF